MSQRVSAGCPDRRRASRSRATGLVLLASLGALVVALPSAATMYKWVDADGKTIYSDQPPPTNVKSEIIRPPPPPANPEAVRDLVNAETDMKQRDKQKVENAKQAQKKLADAARRQELCGNALAQIQSLQREDLYRIDAKGERVYFDADARRQETDAQQKIVRENCSN